MCLVVLAGFIIRCRKTNKPFVQALGIYTLYRCKSVCFTGKVVMLINDTAAGGIGDLFARGIGHSHVQADDNVFQAAASALSIASVGRCFRICCYGFQPFVCCFFVTA